MAHKTTGVFRVPVSENGIEPTALNIMLNNDSCNNTHRVSVIVEKSVNTFFPNTNPLNEIEHTHVTLMPNHTTKIVIFRPRFNLEDFLNITIRGREEAVENILVYSFLADSAGHNIPSTVFNNQDYTFDD
ncbi:hypothetical protein [Bacillus sp. JJ722]|uniref:hypothetical protein n=1 Tax=Bacillus sp. JJ722 TaxID=3122973 RepID=UPI003000DB61